MLSPQNLKQRTECLVWEWTEAHCVGSIAEGPASSWQESPSWWEYLVQQRAFCNHCLFWGKQSAEKIACQDPMFSIWVQACLFKTSPVLAATYRRHSGGPIGHTACLWLQRISTTDACLTNMTLNEGEWQGT